MTDKADDTLLLSILKDIRTELGGHRTLLLQQVDYTRRLEQRIEAHLISIDRRLLDLKDDLELMIKSELMGRLGHFETQIENKIAAAFEKPGS